MKILTVKAYEVPTRFYVFDGCLQPLHFLRL